MTFSGGLMSVMRATGELTSRLRRVVEAVAIFVGGPCGLRSAGQPRSGGCVPTRAVLNVDGLLPRLANRRQGVACTRFLFDPLPLLAEYVEQEIFIFRVREIFFP